MNARVFALLMLLCGGAVSPLAADESKRRDGTPVVVADVLAKARAEAAMQQRP
jgi:hypothetical protein